MRTLFAKSGSTLVYAVVLVLLGFLAGCPGSKSPSPTAKPSAVPVYVILEGPWVVAPDPDVSGGYLAIAPFMKDHDALYVKSHDSFTLSPGEYTLTVPNIQTSLTKSYRPHTATISTATLQRVQHQGGWVRYAIHLPPPNAITEESAEDSRIRTQPPVWPVLSPYVQGPFTVEPAFQYAVTGGSGISLGFLNGAGPDPNPPSPPLDTTPVQFPSPITLGNPGLIRIGSEPSAEDLSACDVQSKETFMTLAKLFQLNEAIDYPAYSASCQVCDPQGTGIKPCPFIQDLNALEHYAKSVEGPESSEALNIIAARELVSGKTAGDDGQKELLERLARTQSFLAKHPPKKPWDSALALALQNLPIVVHVENLPHKDCKAPVIELTLQ
jgi:hypothetical protein